MDDDGVPADVERYGRCDHESSCGYCMYPTSEPTRPGGYIPAARKHPVKRTEVPNTTPCTILEDIVARTTVFTRRNALIQFLLGVFPEEAVRYVAELYQLGTTRDGFAVFYQIDTLGRCRTGKVMKYDPNTGHRIKDSSVSAAMWVHSRLKALHLLPESWSLTQCLFGEHLLTLFPDKTIGLVESEKTALICACAMPEYVWLATGGKSQFNDRLLALKGRKVSDYPMLDITLSD